jgi:peptidoglycan/xylan/chitin deacetylase (PgdA/CDA1 family)
MKPARLSLSIDDGHPADLRMAELLMRHGLRATFYIPMRNCEGPPVLSPSAIRELARHFEIGSHTLEHRFLTRLSVLDALTQIQEGKAALEDLLGKKVEGFCYPGGKYRPLHIKMVQSAGFSYARTTKNLFLSEGIKPYELPTTLQFYPHPRSVVLRNFISQGDWKKRRTALNVIGYESDWLDRLYLLVDYAARSGRVCHLWCHSLDMDKLGLWKRLDELLRFAARRFTASQRLDNSQLAATAMEFE